LSDHSPVALFLVDILNDFDFSDAGESLKKASTLAEKTAAPERRCRKVGIPAIYANDNRGKWRSDASDLVKECLNDDAPGRPLVEPLVPLRNDETQSCPTKHGSGEASPLLREGGVAAP